VVVSHRGEGVEQAGHDARAESERRGRCQALHHVAATRLVDRRPGLTRDGRDGGRTEGKCGHGFSVSR